jgi:hypothetical protein
LNSTYKLTSGDIENVSLLEYDGKLEWEYNETGLIVHLPEQESNDYAVVLK